MLKNNYRLKFTPSARKDLDTIYDYIVNELYAKEAANKLLEKIEASIMRLRDFPFSCSFVEDGFLRSKGYRKLVVDNYLVFYLVHEEEKLVVIMRVLYGRREYQDLL
jgi:toxin ParE1/3/4